MWKLSVELTCETLHQDVLVTLRRSSESSLFSRSLLQKETYNFKEPTNCSHPIQMCVKYLKIWLVRLCIEIYWSVGSIELYASFEEYRLFSRALLQKRPIISMRLPIVATPYKGVSNICRADLWDFVLRCVGHVSSKFKSLFCLFSRAFLQKRPMILRSLLIVATLYKGVSNTCRADLWDFVLRCVGQ